MDKKEKTSVSLSIDKELNKKIEELFNNKSKYIEWLIYQNMILNNIKISKDIIV